jgi:menaquinone-dependent protoporphyrinogen oxidase
VRRHYSAAPARIKQATVAVEPDGRAHFLPWLGEQPQFVQSIRPDRYAEPPNASRSRGTRLAHSSNDSMANVLIVYATKEGQTEKIVRRIEQTLVGEGHAVELRNAERRGADSDLERFDTVVIGAPVHMAAYPRSIVRFVQRHRAALERVRSVFFSVSLAVASRTHDGRAQTLEVVEKFVRQTGFRPGRVELFAGALLYTRYNPLIRFIMRRISASEGGDTDTSRDYEYTDFDAVERFARELFEGRPDGDRTRTAPRPVEVRP